MHIVTVVGARPQFIKVAAVSRVLRGTPGVRETLLHTEQHYDANLSDIFFDELEIPPPDYRLGIRSGSHGAQTGRMLEAIETVLLDEKPDWVLVYGDTNSTLAGAVAAAKLHIPVAHVEAGLRSFNRRMPEEINRILTDHCSDLLFAPTDAAVANLEREGVAAGRVHCVGDVMYDASVYFGAKAERTSVIREELNLEPQGYVLATIHRAENTDDSGRLRAIAAGLAAVARQVPVVLPLHPRTRAALQREGIYETYAASLRMVDPVGYLDMTMLEKSARLIVTDSGGVQKESFFHGVPCVTLRDETEWVELVEAGWNCLAPPGSSQAVAECILDALHTARSAEERPSLYGGGRAAERIVGLLRAQA